MARYIDADRLLLVLEKNFGHTGGADTLKQLIDIQPTADVVEVVRCKDCDIPHNKWTGCPKLNGLIPPPDFFCSYGERKGGAE